MKEDKTPQKNAPEKPRKRVQKGPNQRLRQRSAILIIVILVLGFGAVLTRLSILTVVQGNEHRKNAVEQQLTDITLTAKRGTIFDANGTVLAESASVWQVVMSPVNFKTDEQRVAAARGLSDILKLDYDNVLKKTEKKSFYTVVQRKIEVEERDKILELINKLSEEYQCDQVISLLDDYKRYYPKNDLASCVIGFAGADEQGLEGVTTSIFPVHPEDWSPRRTRAAPICRSPMSRTFPQRTATTFILQSTKKSSLSVKNIWLRA